MFVSKHTFRFFIIQVIAMTFVMANTSEGQTLKDTKVTLKVSDASLMKIFEVIEGQTLFTFGYNGKVINNKQKLSLEYQEESLLDVLNYISNESSLHFKRINRTISVTKKSPLEGGVKPKNQEPKANLDRTITGKVTDENGEPLPGATIRVKGTSIGASTDVDGNYTLSVPDDAETLVIRFVGFVTQEVSIGARSVIDIPLAIDTKSLDEVTVSTGYWEVEKKYNPGNIARVDSKTIEQQPVANPLQSIQGRMAGVLVTQQTGLPSGGFSIQIRGQNSLRQGAIGVNDPLYIVDGVQFPATSIGGRIGGILQDNVNPLSGINPNDIESIEVLKDADATAIYGSRGANGVVLIKTKNGKSVSGKTDVTFSHSSGFSTVPTRMDLLNTDEYLEMRREAWANDGRTFNAGSAPDLVVWDTTRQTDWQEELLGGNAYTSNSSVSISGGNQNTSFLIGGTYYTEETVFPGEFGYSRVSGNASVGHASDNGKFRINLSTFYSFANNSLPREDLTSDALTLAPNAPALYDSIGNVNWEDNSFTNPIAGLASNVYESTNSNLITNASLSYEVIDGLFLKGNLGFTSVVLEEIAINPLSARRPDIRSRFQTDTRKSTNINRTWIVEPQIQYNKGTDFGDFSILLGSTIQSNVVDGETVQGIGFPSDAFARNLQAAEQLFFIPVFEEYKFASSYLRINYLLKDRYTLNLTGRRDGSSRFGPGQQFGNFGAIGAAWIFSEESFIKNSLSFLSFGKLRASYGITGSDNIGAYQYLSSYSVPNPGTYQGLIGLVPTRLPNDNFSWEETSKLEFGFESAWLDDRIQIGLSWFRNRSSNQLLRLNLPTLTGANSIAFNRDATVENRGWEVEIVTNNIRRNNFSWSTSFNITIPENELIDYPDLETSQDANRYQIGEPVNIQYILDYVGINPETGEYEFRDIDKDGRLVASRDRDFLDEIGPRFFGGISNEFTYKGFSLSVFFEFRNQRGFDYRNAFLWPGAFSNQPDVVTDRWRNPGDETEIQRYTALNSRRPYLNLDSSTGGIVDASFIRLRNVSITYSIPSSLLEKINASSANVFLQGQNLLIFADDYIGLDPETQSSFRLPPLRTITAGFQVTF